MGKRLTPRVNENSPEIGSRVWRIRDIELDERLLELRVAGVEVRIEPKPLSVLMILLRHPDRLVTARELIGTVWNGRQVNEQVIAQTVARLRRALGPDHASLVRTVHGWGYRLTQSAEGAKPTQRAGTRGGKFRSGDEHPLRRGWTLLEPLAINDAQAWLIEHSDSGLRRILLHLRRVAEIENATREISQYNGAVQGGKLDGLICHALDWNFDATRGPGLIEYPANLQALPDWIESQGGFAALSLKARLELAARVCDRLSGAHDHGVRFGRLAPSSIVVGHGSDEPMIYLPGAMHRIHPLCARLYAGAWTGHEALYIAPELRRGEAASVAADVFSLGVMTLQLVLGDWTALPIPGWREQIEDHGLLRLIERSAACRAEERHASLRQLAAEIRDCIPSA